MATRFVARGKWKKVNVDSNIFTQKDLENLVCLEELTDYDILTTSKHTKRKSEKSIKIAPPSNKKRKLDRSSKEFQHPPKKMKKFDAKNARHDSSRVTTRCDNDSAESEVSLKNVRDSATVESVKKSKKLNVEPVDSAPTLHRVHDMSAWDGLYVPECVLKSLDENGFVAPTPIQALVLPPATRDRRDIIGAAETGSGKTLSFGIPIVHHILQDKQTLVTDCPSDEDQSHTRDMKPLYALIITPTRELAIQVKNHIEAITKHTDIQVCPVVGGMSVEKQARLLKRSPDIVVGTPGRLWQLIQQGNGHLSKVKDIKYLVIDEADRMVEKNHFPELSSLLQLINDDAVPHRKRQTFVFSATLTFVHEKPKRLDLKKKKTHQMTTAEKLDLLRSQVGMSDKPKLIDLTRPDSTSSSLTEARINCTMEEKDSYLYHFMIQFPGRTLVFCNSIDCVRRLVSVFQLLHCTPLPLHAEMNQRQRLKNLDRFKANTHALLIATDVAARGLDIPDIQHVVHYQVPRTTENYVHRSGRTARALKEGLSIMLVGPDDVVNYRKIIKALNRDEELPVFPVEFEYLPVIKSRVSLARLIDKEQHSVSKRKAHDVWLEQAARDMDIELSTDNDSDDDIADNSHERAAQSRKLSAMRQQLDAMLSQPIRNQTQSGKYPTKSGTLFQPFMNVRSQEGAVDKMKADCKRKQKKR